MTTGKSQDVSAQRLLTAIGSELEYFSAAGEHAIREALQSWPLLAAIWRVLPGERAGNERPARGTTAAADVDPPLRVVDGAKGASFDGDDIEAADGARLPEPTPKEN